MDKKAPTIVRIRELENIRRPRVSKRLKREWNKKWSWNESANKTILWKINRILPENTQKSL